MWQICHIKSVSSGKKNAFGFTEEKNKSKKNEKRSPTWPHAVSVWLLAVDLCVFWRIEFIVWRIIRHPHGAVVDGTVIFLWWQNTHRLAVTTDEKGSGSDNSEPQRHIRKHWFSFIQRVLSLNKDDTYLICRFRHRHSFKTFCQFIFLFKR